MPILDFGILKSASERIYSATQGTGQEIKYLFNISQLRSTYE